MPALGDADRAEMAEVVRRLAAALARRDVVAILALLRTKDADLARAFGEPPATSEADERRFFEADVFAANYAWAPVAAADITYRQIAGNRAVELGSRSGHDLIRGVGRDGGVYSLALILAKLDGVWVIVR